MQDNTSHELKKGLDEILKDFDLVPKSNDLYQSELRYRRLMAQMLEKLLEEQRSRIRMLESGMKADLGMARPISKPERTLPEKPDDFPQQSPRIDQVLYFIKREGKPLLLREIVQCFAESDYQAAHHPAVYGNSLSVYLSQGLKRGRIKRYSLPRKRGGWYYPNSWANDKGELAEEYLKMID